MQSYNWGSVAGSQSYEQIDTEEQECSAKGLRVTMRSEATMAKWSSYNMQAKQRQS